MKNEISSFIKNCLTLTLVMVAIVLQAQKEKYKGAEKNCKRILKVSLYPYIPNPNQFYSEIEKEFEKKYSNIDLVINLRTIDYYDSIIKEQADVYELDCAFIQDMIKLKKIKELPSTLLTGDDMMPAGNIVFQNNKRYGVPHWLCGNFLFYNAQDLKIKDANSFEDLLKEFKTTPPSDSSLLIDLCGTTTFGEYYLNALFDTYGNIHEAKKYFHSNKVDSNSSILSYFDKLSSASYNKWNSTKKYHKKVSYYGRQFARGNARAYVGYSESLSATMDIINNSYSIEEPSPVKDKIEIKNWSFKINEAQHLGWVDAFVIDSKLNGDKLNDASKFINFMISDSAYYLALIPHNDPLETPRYLLPAYKHLYSDQKILEAGQLYSKLYPLALNLVAVSWEGMLTSLNEIGALMKRKYCTN